VPVSDSWRLALTAIGFALVTRWRWQFEQKRKLAKAGPVSRHQRTADAALLIIGSAIASLAFFYGVSGHLFDSGSLAVLVIFLWVQSWRIRLKKEGSGRPLISDDSPHNSGPFR